MLFNFLLRLSECASISCCSLLSIIGWMICQLLFHVLAHFKCALYSCSFSFCFLTYKNFISWLMRKRVSFCSVFWLRLLFLFTCMDIYLGVIYLCMSCCTRWLQLFYTVSFLCCGISLLLLPVWHQSRFISQNSWLIWCRLWQLYLYLALGFAVGWNINTGRQSKLSVLTRKVVSGILYPYNSDKTNAKKSEISTKIDFYSYRRPQRHASCSAGVICRGCGVVTCNIQPSI